MSSRSAVTLILGVSISALAMGFAACDSGTSDDGGAAGGGLVPVGGSPGGAGAPAAGAGAPAAGAGAPAAGAGAPAGGGAPPAGGGASSSGGSDLPAGVPLDPMDGWVAMESNTLMVQGAFFPYADPTSLMSQTSDFIGTHACIKGSAAKVDLTCTPMAPATDCYGQFWGAAVGLNLNQPIDMTLVPPAGGMPMPFNASTLKGFAFEVEGTTVPAPKDFRFKVEDATGEFCNVPTKKIVLGVNTVLFSDLVKACYKITTTPPNEPATAHQMGLLKIAWQVVTNTTGAVPYDFCISNLRAIPN